MKSKVGRYSVYIRPFTYIIDLLIINVMAYYFLPTPFISIFFSCFISLSWIILSLNIGFYEVYRFTKVVEIGNKIFKQYGLFTILCYSYSGFYINNAENIEVFKYCTYSVLIIATIKISIYYLLRKYRSLLGGNRRKVVIIGHQNNVSQLQHFFDENPDYGYHLIKVFSHNQSGNKDLESCFDFVKSNKIDEIYVSALDLNQQEIIEVIDFADNNLKVLKFLANSPESISANMKIDYYGYIKIASLREIPLDDILNQLTKRAFDIIFSSLIILFVLTWLIPLIAILIKLESKGPIFFKQKRNGLNYSEFNCYKFRSMFINMEADSNQAVKNDARITRIGKFIRKTSLDEFPQFFNVFLGDMSVVGPRPHMVSHTEMYARKVDKFMVRHFIKPGITGLAQTNGFRGEVENDQDIIYRVKYDIFYMENWSLLLDIKIIFMTFINAIKGEEKAY